MIYQGSKAKYAKEIIPILQKIIDDNDITTYIEPFCGGANVIDKIKCENKIAYDRSKYLIALFKQAQEDFSIIPQHGNREWWDKAKAIYRGDSDEQMEDYLVGAICYFASFGTRGFPGGYAKVTEDRDPYKERYDNFKKQIPHIQDIDFRVSEYQDIIIPDGSLVYCDPPYQGVKQYGYAFENTFNWNDYWDWVRTYSETNIIVCSEQTFPDDFEIIWEKQTRRSIGSDNGFKAIEKIGIYHS